MRRPSWNRVHGVRMVLQDRYDAAREAESDPERSEQSSIALRGKARGYREAIDLITRLERGQDIHRERRWLTSARRGRS